MTAYTEGRFSEDGANPYPANSDQAKAFDEGYAAAWKLDETYLFSSRCY